MTTDQYFWNWFNDHQGLLKNLQTRSPKLQQHYMLWLNRHREKLLHEHIGFVKLAQWHEGLQHVTLDLYDLYSYVKYIRLNGK